MESLLRKKDTDPTGTDWIGPVEQQASLPPESACCQHSPSLHLPSPCHMYLPQWVPRGFLAEQVLHSYRVLPLFRIYLPCMWQSGSGDGARKHKLQAAWRTLPRRSEVQVPTYCTCTVQIPGVLLVDGGSMLSACMWPPTSTLANIETHKYQLVVLPCSLSRLVLVGISPHSSVLLFPPLVPFTFVRDAHL